MALSRRRFLSNLGLMVSATSTLSGCSTLDSFFRGEETDETKQIVILGAGMAGLMAAFECRKAGVPFRVFEASRRPGGRVLTLREFNSSQQEAELGAEWIQPEHSTALEVGKDLRVRFIERRFTTPLFLPAEDKKVQGSFQAMKELAQKKVRESYGRQKEILNSFNREQYPKAAQLDEMTAAQVYGSYPALEAFCLREFGVESHRVSALYVTHRLADMQETPYTRLYRVGGGLQTFAQALFDRVAGIIAEKNVRLEHALIEIESDGAFFNLTFESPQGEKTIRARHVICTLPWSVLRQIKGWTSLRLSPQLKDWIQTLKYGSQSKAAFGFSEKVWKKENQLKTTGSWWLPDSKSWIYDSTESFDVTSTFGRGILTAVQGGSEGEKWLPGEEMALIEKLASVWKTPTLMERLEGHQMHNWWQYPWSRGSHSYLAPGEFQKRVAAHDEGYNWVFAGEHLSIRWPGTVNGALESGMEAAQSLIAKRAL